MEGWIIIIQGGAGPRNEACWATRQVPQVVLRHPITARPPSRPPPLLLPPPLSPKTVLVEFISSTFFYDLWISRPTLFLHYSPLDFA